MRLKGKTALVAGGTAGIGLAVARAYVGEGARVVIGGRRADGAEIATEASAAFVTLDVSDPDSWSAALEQVDVLDVVVLNAGVAQPPVGIADLSAKAASKVVAVNLLGTFWGLQQCPARMADGGSIVITSSISAVTGTSFEALYGATKAGVSSLARSAAIDLGPRGIRVNAVQPGPTWTDMNPMPEGLLEIVAPLGRKGRVEDLTGLYVFLASGESAYLTGQAISVDGGVTAGTSQAHLRVLGRALREEAVT